MYNMKQKIVAKLNGNIEILEIPGSKDEILPGIPWGDHTNLFTPACWRTQLWFEQDSNVFKSHRLGKTLAEEISACILGGYGIPAEVGMAAFYKLRSKGVFETASKEEDIFKVLADPLEINNKQIKYRFAKQKSNYLHYALEKAFSQKPPVHNAVEFRTWLTEIKGVGLKTASWITRNWLNSDEVAIIDIHIYRAGILMGMYDFTQNPSKDYIEMEESFLALAKGMEVKASQLDALIWQEMKVAGSMVLRRINKVISH